MSGVRVSMSPASVETKRVLDPMEVRLQVDVSFQVRILGTELQCLLLAAEPFSSRGESLAALS